MAGIRVILLIRSGDVGWVRQYAACRSYVGLHGYEVVDLVRSEDDLVRLLRDGVAEVVIAAYDLAGDDERLRTLVEGAGGRLEYCRAPRHRVPLPDPEPIGHDTDEIVRRMAGRGGTVDEIARLLGIPLERVREILRR